MISYIVNDEKGNTLKKILKFKINLKSVVANLIVKPRK
jgi:hypothetical protein